MILPIVGAHFRPPAKIILNCLQAGHRLLLLPEPSNPYDAFAIQVCVESETLEDLPDGIIAELELKLPSTGYSLEDIFDVVRRHLGFIPAIDAKNFHIPPEGIDGKLAYTLAGKPAVDVKLEDWIRE